MPVEFLAAKLMEYKIPDTVLKHKVLKILWRLGFWLRTNIKHANLHGNLILHFYVIDRYTKCNFEKKSE